MMTAMNHSDWTPRSGTQVPQVVQDINLNLNHFCTFYEINLSHESQLELCGLFRVKGGSYRSMVRYFPEGRKGQLISEMKRIAVKSFSELVDDFASPSGNGSRMRHLGG
jgi:hypothetical protein